MIIDFYLIPKLCWENGCFEKQVFLPIFGSAAFTRIQGRYLAGQKCVFRSGSSSIIHFCDTVCIVSHFTYILHIKLWNMKSFKWKYKNFLLTKIKIRLCFYMILDLFFFNLSMYLSVVYNHLSIYLSMCIYSSIYLSIKPFSPLFILYIYFFLCRSYGRFVLVFILLFMMIAWKQEGPALNCSPHAIPPHKIIIL